VSILDTIIADFSVFFGRRLNPLNPDPTPPPPRSKPRASNMTFDPSGGHTNAAGNPILVRPSITDGALVVPDWTRAASAPERYTHGAGPLIGAPPPATHVPWRTPRNLEPPPLRGVRLQTIQIGDESMLAPVAEIAIPLSVVPTSPLSPVGPDGLPLWVPPGPPTDARTGRLAPLAQATPKLLGKGVFSFAGSSSAGLRLQRAPAFGADDV